MATTALFKPYTDNFGHLTLHATILGDGAVITPEDRQSRVNMMIILTFVLGLIAAAVALYAADTMLFSHHDHAPQAYAGMMIDAD